MSYSFGLSALRIQRDALCANHCNFEDKVGAAVGLWKCEISPRVGRTLLAKLR